MDPYAAGCTEYNGVDRDGDDVRVDLLGSSDLPVETPAALAGSVVAAPSQVVSATAITDDDEKKKLMTDLLKIMMRENDDTVIRSLQKGLIKTELEKEQRLILLQECCDEYQLPKIVGNAGAQWFRRWRNEVGIVYKTTGMQLKVSWSKILTRVKVLLGNIFRIHCFWNHCHPDKQLRFISLDQKPPWFNNAGHKGTLGKKGGPQPGVQGNFSQTRERYSILTLVRNYDNDNPAEPPPVEILFRASERERRTIG